MKVFISWSGTRSRKTAKLLYEWLPQIINEVEPWMSDVDIASGGDWNDEIRKHLNTAQFGIICVTPGNMRREWLLFEAGALSRQVKDSASRVAPFLIGFNEKSELRYPLARFQATEPTHDDMKKLLLSLNSECERPRDPAQIEQALKVFWPTFEKPFVKVRDSVASQPPERRSERDLLEELLALVRAMEKRGTEPTQSSMRFLRVPGGSTSVVRTAPGAGKTSGAFLSTTVRVASTLAALYGGLSGLQFALESNDLDPTDESDLVIRLRDLAHGHDIANRLAMVEELLRNGGLNARVEIIDFGEEDERDDQS